MDRPELVALLIRLAHCVREAHHTRRLLAVRQTIGVAKFVHGLLGGARHEEVLITWCAPELLS
jgi:hypothetical protein